MTYNFLNILNTYLSGKAGFWNKMYTQKFTHSYAHRLKIIFSCVMPIKLGMVIPSAWVAEGKPSDLVETVSAPPCVFLLILLVTLLYFFCHILGHTCLSTLL